MLGRYAELKAQLPEGTILFYQVGTFFETFEEDAKRISQALSIRLTSREAAGEGRVPLAGVPGHALQEHLATLLRKGYTVAVAEQRQHPTKPKQFTREVTRVLTPGTVIEDNVLSAGQANYLAAFVVRDGLAGIAVVEASTGEFTGTEVSEEQLPAELERWSPREIVVPERTAAERLPKVRAAVSPAPLDVRALRRGAGAEETLRGLQSQRIRDRRAPGARRRSRGPDPVPRFPSWRRSAGAGGDLPSIRSWLGDGPRRGDEAQPGPGRGRRDRRPDLHADGPARAQALAGASPAGGGSHQATSRGRRRARRRLHVARGCA